MVLLLDRRIDRVSVVDDDPDARDVYGYTIEDAELVPVAEDGPLMAVDRSVREIADHAQAVLCDHYLRKRSYANFDGAELVAACYDRGLPAVLCTRFERPDIESIRRFRRKIPVLLSGDDLDPDRLVKALEECLREFAYGPDPHRRPWRNQVRVVDVGDKDRGVFYVTVPGWRGDERIGVLRADVPPGVRARLVEGYRLHAKVNIGAESADELFFQDWEEE